MDTWDKGVIPVSLDGRSEMAVNQKNGFMKYFVTFTFLLMVTVNALANILPINGQTTGQISDTYPNLFAPAGLTFAIWGLIYLLLAGYTLYQLGLFRDSSSKIEGMLLNRIGLFFSISSLANAAWIFAWHYHLITLSMLLMLVILMCLIIITEVIKNAELSPRDRIFARLPFSVYFGWITVATIANATVLLVSLGWNRFGLPEAVWAVVMILAGFIIGTATMLKNKDIAYGLVIIWAYLGILIKHISAGEFAGKYPSVIAAVLICIILLIVAEIYMLVLARKGFRKLA